MIYTSRGFQGITLKGGGSAEPSLNLWAGYTSSGFQGNYDVWTFGFRTTPQGRN